MVVDLSKIGDYWHIGSVIIALTVSLVYFVIENKEASKTIKELSDANKILSEKVYKLEGNSEGFNHAIKMFMEHPPGIIEYRVGILEKKVFGTTQSDLHSESVPVSIAPPSAK
jgi:hypothetical protein